MYMYEGERYYLRSNAIGVKLGPPALRLELFARHRLEGHPADDIPTSLAGMARRDPGVDLGMGVQWGGRWGVVYAELLQDATSASEGSELRLGYKAPRKRGRLSVTPYARLDVRNSELNDYYYGVRETEATAERPVYRVDGATIPEIGVLAAYELTQRWRLLAGATLARLPDAIAESPIVERRIVHSITLGAIYELSPEPRRKPQDSPRLIGRVFYGASTDCDAVPIMTLRCTSTHTQDETSVAGYELGRPLVDGLNGWPLDVAAFVGFIRHKERGLQDDFWQINAYLKAYFYGFPWDARVRTRLGMGLGLSLADQIPFSERRDLEARGRGTSKLMQTLDPTVDFSVGDLVGSSRLRETFVGVGVTHRSGIFGSSRLLRNVNGGSNYIYTYVEASF